MNETQKRKKVVILGAGFGGAYAAKEFVKIADPKEFELILIDQRDYFVYTPLLVEAAVGIIEPRHVVVPIRKFLNRKGEFICAKVKSLNTANQVVEIEHLESGESKQIKYDGLIFALGSASKPPPIDGFQGRGYELKTLNDGIVIRDRVIELLEAASAVDTEEEQKALLRFVVIGANYSGVEIAGEIDAFIKRAIYDFPKLKKEFIEVVLIEFSGSILASMPSKLQVYVQKKFKERNIRILLNNTVSSMTTNEATLKSGEVIKTRMVIWTAGNIPSPLIKATGLTTNERGYIKCDNGMKAEGLASVWAIGDCATVLDSQGVPYAATAQNASRQGPLAAKNLLSNLSSKKKIDEKPYVFTPLGSFASFGNEEAAADVLGRTFTGKLGWFIYRSAYLVKMPTFRQKLRLSVDWFLDLILPYPAVQLGVHRSQVKEQESN